MCTRQGSLTQHRLSGRHRGQRSGRRHAQRCHSLADEVFAQHGAERGAAVGAAGEGRPPGPLELDVVPQAVPPDDLAEQDRAPVPELRYEVAELVPSIGERDWRRPFRYAIPGQDFDALGASQLLGVEPKVHGEVGIQTHQTWRRHRHRIKASE